MSANIPDNFDRSDPRNLKVVRIESDMKHYIYIPYKGRQINSSALAHLLLLLLLQKKTDEILNPSDKLQQLKELFNDLNDLKILLKSLATKDTSQDYQFADALSKNWHNILENTHIHPPLLNKLIHTLQNYPLNTDHTLGYYLTKFTGETWLPFPFMEILYTLHENALLNRANSTLTSWIKQIDDILYTQK